MQIVNVAKALLPPEARDAVQQCIGGANIKRQLEALKKNKPALVVGTPGRLATLGRDAKLLIHNCNMLVVDEVSCGEICVVWACSSALAQQYMGKIC
jgi:superfamily II DNA/RNA helicase